MSLRAIFLAMVLANLIFFGWAHFIDVPPAPPPSDTLGGLPRLKLLHKVHSPRAAQNSSAQANSTASPTPQQQSSDSSAVAAQAGTPAASAAGGATAAPGSSHQNLPTSLQDPASTSAAAEK